MMKFSDAKQQFISSWGAFGTQWGINRTMASIHALLLISPDSLTQDDIMAELRISRGNVNMNIRELISWGLVTRRLISGERKEHFSADKDIWRVATQIVRERKRRELDPMLKLLGELEEIDGDKKDPAVKEFTTVIKNIRTLGNQTDKILDAAVRAEENWFTSKLLKLFH